MSSFEKIAAEIDRTLLKQDIRDHIQKRGPDRQNPQPISPIDQPPSPAPNHPFHSQTQRQAKVETITIPSTANKIVITLEA